jgi:hypothetical protein
MVKRATDTQLKKHHMFVVCLVHHVFPYVKHMCFICFKKVVFKNICFSYVRLTYVKQDHMKDMCQQTYVKLMVITNFSYEYVFRIIVSIVK